MKLVKSFILIIAVKTNLKLNSLTVATYCRVGNILGVNFCKFHCQYCLHIIVNIFHGTSINSIACSINNQMSGVILLANKHENSVFKLYVKFTCLESFPILPVAYTVFIILVQ